MQCRFFKVFHICIVIFNFTLAYGQDKTEDLEIELLKQCVLQAMPSLETEEYVLLFGETLNWYQSGEELDRVHLAESSLISEDLMRRFFEKNRKQIKLKGDLNLKIIVKDKSLNKLRNLKNTNKAVAVFICSRIAFDRDMKKGLMSYKKYYGENHTEGGFVLFTKIGKYTWACNEIFDAPTIGN